MSGKGIKQRIKNHLNGYSSFIKNYFQGNGKILIKNKYTYQYIELEDSRKRALLEAYTCGVLCPVYIGLN
ncbi:MAG: hypothetical protein HQK76_20540 [Desulfobacterales bacterium]|nr:hypothetical protein [Desulfobacterales bacterium]